ncbi:phage minor capsid protein [Lacrimispora sp. 38-1]|uniref:phage minor capsid protein n=1 Tax=Lacrimispora sp. 38-1 TaxID=3125778 RepID=UPI003CF45C0E
MNEYDISGAFEAIEQELIASMIRNMDRHRAEELKEGYDWSMWQTEQLKALEKYKLQNQKKYSKQFKSINAQIGELIWQARQQGGMKQEEQILRAIKNGFKSYKLTSAAMQAEFFKLNTRKLEALVKATSNDMQKAETAVLRMANDQYRKAIFNAHVYANSGAGTYEKAVDMATKDMLSRGLNCVEYKNGARHALSDYADMAIRTASKRAYLQGEGEKRQEWGISTVIVGKRGNPCPKCLPFVGKVLIDDVWSGGKASDGPYPLMSAAIARGLYHPRCKDSHSTYFPGISTADDTWTREELKSIEKTYKQEQEQKYAQRQAEKYGRLAEYSLSADNQEKYSTRKKEWEAVVKNFNSGIIKAEKVVSGHTGTPKLANPGSVIDHVDKSGKVDVRSIYGDDGLKDKDIHTTNHGNPKNHPYGENGEHAHDYDWDDEQKLRNKTTRELTESERKENSDIL